MRETKIAEQLKAIPPNPAGRNRKQNSNRKACITLVVNTERSEGCQVLKNYSTPKQITQPFPEGQPAKTNIH